MQALGFRVSRSCSSTQPLNLGGKVLCQPTLPNRNDNVSFFTSFWRNKVYWSWMIQYFITRRTKLDIKWYHHLRWGRWLSQYSAWLARRRMWVQSPEPIWRRWVWWCTYVTIAPGRWNNTYPWTSLIDVRDSTLNQQTNNMDSAWGTTNNTRDCPLVSRACTCIHLYTYENTHTCAHI